MLKVGKLSGERLQGLILSKLGYRRPDVLVHAGLGEDSAVIDFGDEVCVVSTDPITGASEGIGELAVHISCNDIASNGAVPVGVQVLLLLPEGVNDSQISMIMEEIAQTARLLEVEIIGGHTEITSKVSDVVVAVTAIGRAKRNKYVTSSGARVGDHLVITKGVGIEGSIILASELAKCGINLSTEEIAIQKGKLSVVKEGLLAANYGVHAMHDMTEGGLKGAVSELASASQVGFLIQEQNVHVPDLTKTVCDFFSLDPLALLSSGSMLISCSDGLGLVKHLANNQIESFVVGEVTKRQDRILYRTTGLKEQIPLFVEDELWRFYDSRETS